MAETTVKEKKYPDWWFQSPYQKELDSLAGQIASRPIFKFKVDHEALYNYYKGEHDRQGRETKMDTQAKIAGLTGGYDNSYARRAGQQAYEGQMARLQEEVAPDLRKMALDKYTREGEDLADRYTSLQKQDKKAYEQWLTDNQDRIIAWQEQEGQPENPGVNQNGMPTLGDYRSAVLNSIRDGIGAKRDYASAIQRPQYADSILYKQDTADDPLNNNGFSVENYAQAVERLRGIGVFDRVIQNLLSESAWNDVVKENKKVTETGEGTFNIAGSYGSYTEYLRAYVANAERAMANKRPGYVGNHSTGVGGHSGATNATA